MRYALRKQDKIKAVLGNEYLENNILQSLNKYFENSENAGYIQTLNRTGTLRITATNTHC